MFSLAGSESQTSIQTCQIMAKCNPIVTTTLESAEFGLFCELRRRIFKVSAGAATRNRSDSRKFKIHNHALFLYFISLTGKFNVEIGSELCDNLFFGVFLLLLHGKAARQHADHSGRTTHRTRTQALPARLL
jgi:hypothetical protein